MTRASRSTTSCNAGNVRFMRPHGPVRLSMISIPTIWNTMARPGRKKPTSGCEVSQCGCYLYIYIYILVLFLYSYTVHMKYAHCRYDIYIYIYMYIYIYIYIYMYTYHIVRWSTLVCCDIQIDVFFLNWTAFTVEETGWTFGVENVLFVGPVSRPTTPSWLRRNPQRQSCVQDVWWETSSCSVTAMCQYNLVPHFIVPSRWTLARVLSSALEEMWIVFFTSRWLGQISGFSWEQWLEHGTYVDRMCKVLKVLKVVVLAYVSCKS